MVHTEDPPTSDHTVAVDFCMCETGTGNKNSDVHFYPQQLNIGGHIQVYHDEQEKFTPFKVIQGCQQSITTHPTEWRRTWKGSSQQKGQASYTG